MMRTIKASESLSSSSSSSEWILLCRSKDWPSLLLGAAQLQQQQLKSNNGHGIDYSHGKMATCKGASCKPESAISYGIFNSESILNNSANITSSSSLSHPLGTSILSLALRAGAPLDVLETLIQLDPQQLYQVTTTTTTSTLPSSSSSSSEPRGITILHDAVRYSCIRSSSHDDDSGWKILEFLVARIMHLQQQHGGNEQESKIQNLQQESSSSSSSSWCVGNIMEDRYTTLPSVRTCLPSSTHVLEAASSTSSSNLFAIQDNAGRTALHYLVEQQLRQMLQLLSTFTSRDDDDDDDDDADTDIDEQCSSSSSLSSSISCTLEASWRAFEKMVSANPSVMQIMDSDGNTALVLLLAATTTQHPVAAAAGGSTMPQRQRQNNIMEAEILRRVQLMLKLCPAQVAVSRKVPSSRKAVLSWRIPQWQQQQQQQQQGLWQQQQQQPSAALVANAENDIIPPSDSSTSFLQTCPCNSASTASTSAAAADPTAFPVHGLPLYFAILYGRCPETILEVVRAQRCMGYNGCSVIVTQYAELCLHIAVTRRAPLAVIKLLVDEYPAATLAPDVNGLTPLEWLWMVHVMDWHQAATTMHQQQHQQNNDDNQNGPADEWAFSLLSPSRRRFLHRDYMEWYHAILDHHCTPYTADRYDFMDTKTGRAMQSELLQRMKILLPRAAAAAEIGVAPCLKTISLVHAACQLCGCLPRGMLQMVFAMDPGARGQLRSPDGATNRYPLHYAAAAPFTGYRASLPLSPITRGVSLLHEESPVALILSHFPEASRVTDVNGQLPLHIAIDAAKSIGQYCRVEHHFSASACTTAATTSSGAATPPSPAITNEEESTALDLLLSQWPDSIRQRDGKTSLFPWQQAAVGHGASLQTIYTLLRRDPTCVSQFID
jgi:ankyrin repeat protein